MKIEQNLSKCLMDQSNDMNTKRHEYKELQQNNKVSNRLRLNVEK